MNDHLNRHNYKLKNTYKPSVGRLKPYLAMKASCSFGPREP
jgi:hypothetical protein